MKVSVIVLTCDREHWIGRSIRSILRQDFPDFELIVVDNGSRDASGLIAAEYARRDPRVRVLRRKRGTISAGRNAGLDAARSEWIAFFDDDDAAEPDFLSFLVSLAEETDADAAACGSWKEVDGRRLPNFIEDRRLLLTPEQAVLELLLRRRCNAATPTKLFRRSLFSEHRFPERARYDDIAVVYRLFASARRVAFHNLPKYCFTRHGGNSSAFTTNDRLLSPAQLREYFAAFHERTRWLSDRLPRLSAFAVRGILLLSLDVRQADAHSSAGLRTRTALAGGHPAGSAAVARTLPMASGLRAGAAVPAAPERRAVTWQEPLF